MKRAVTKQNTKRNTLVFVAFLLLAGVFHVIEDTPFFLSTVAFCADFLIYTGLILFWTLSVRERLLPSRAKTYIIASALLLLLFFFLRCLKYRVFIFSAASARMCWYCFYIFIVLVPTLFLMSAVYFGASADSRKRNEWLLLIPAGLLVLGVLTNDLHHLAFLPKPGVQEFLGNSGTYTRRFLFYASYTWAGCMTAGGIIRLVLATRKLKSWKKAAPPFLMLGLIPVLILIRSRADARDLQPMYNDPEILIFCLIGALECCIQSRLIPHNENYTGFFAGLRLPAMITDRALQPAYRTALSVAADSGQLREAIAGPVYPDPDTRLSGMAVRAGYAFFTEDESRLNSVNEELRDANEMLSQENEIIERERELTEEKAGIEARSRLYAKAAQEVYPAQKKISELIARAEPNTPRFRTEIAMALPLMAYVKRKANFVLLEAERDRVTAEELASALRESAHYLGYGGMNTAVSVTTERDFPSREAIAVYDCFEAAAEALYGQTAELWLRLADGELLMMADGGRLPPLPELPLPVTAGCADGQITFRFSTCCQENRPLYNVGGERA